MARGAIKFDDLSPETRKVLGLRKPRSQPFTKEQVRQHSIKVLAAIAGLTQSERKRVLKHAYRMNET